MSVQYTHLHEMGGRQLTQVKQKLLNFFLFGFASFRLPTPDSGSAPTMDYAERPFGPGCVSHWSPRTPETIHSDAVPREYTQITHKHTLRQGRPVK